MFLFSFFSNKEFIFDYSGLLGDGFFKISLADGYEIKRFFLTSDPAYENMLKENLNVITIRRNIENFPEHVVEYMASQVERGIFYLLNYQTK